MAEYKNVLSVWLNPSKEGKGCYLAIRNESNEPITIDPGRSIYANMNTRMPIASKSVVVQEPQPQESQQEEEIDGVEDQIPF